MNHESLGGRWLKKQTQTPQQSTVKPSGFLGVFPQEVSEVPLAEIVAFHCQMVDFDEIPKQISTHLAEL